MPQCGVLAPVHWITCCQNKKKYSLLMYDIFFEKDCFDNVLENMIEKSIKK